MTLSSILASSVIAFALIGCADSGTEIAKKAQALAECKLAEKANCDASSPSGTFAIEKATLNKANDAVRVSTSLTKTNECESFGYFAGNSPDSLVVINNLPVKIYGEEHSNGVKRACEASGPFVVSLTVAKSAG